MRAFLRYTCALAALAGASVAAADTFTFDKTEGDWNASSSWYPPNGPPGAGDHAIILNGQTCKVQASDADVGHFTINSGGTIKIYSGRTLEIHDAANASTINGILILDTAAASGAATLTWDLASPVELVGSGYIDARRPGSSGSTAVGKILAVPGVGLEEDLVIGSGIEVYGSVVFDGFDLENNGRLVVDSSFDEMLIAAQYVSNLDGAGTLEVSAGAAELRLVNGDNAQWSLLVSGGTLSIGSGADVDETSMAATVSGGTLSVNSDLGLTLTPSGPAALTISGGTADFNADLTLGNVEVSGGTLQFDVAAAPPGDFVISGGTVDLNAAWSATGDVSISNGTLRFDAASTPTGDFTISGGTVEVNANWSLTQPLVISGGLVDVNTAWSSSQPIALSSGTLQYDAASSPTGTIALSGGTIKVNQNLTGRGIAWTGGSFEVAYQKSATFNIP